MIGNVLIHLGIALSSFSGLAEREVEEIGNVANRAASPTRTDDEHGQGHSSSTTESDAAKPSATTVQHKRFEPFAGTFNAEVKLWTGSGDPTVTTGVMTNTLVLRGRYLQQVFKSDPAPDSWGHGFWGFNQATNKFEGFWIDSRSTKMQIEVGDVDETGTVWTMVGEITGPSGNAVKKRSVITLEDNDRHKVEMFFTRPDGNEVKVVEIRYERV